MSIAALNASFPSSASNAGLGDDELRALKTALKACFGGVAGPVNAGTGNPLATDVELTELFDRATALEAVEVFTPGMIMLWSGSVATIPPLWELCDGATYGAIVTPNLTDRFVLGAGATFNPGNIGGLFAVTTSSVSGSGAGVTGSTQLTVAQLPDLKSAFQINIGGSTSSSSDEHDANNRFARDASGSSTATSAVTTLTGFNNEGHTHTIPAVAAHTHTVATVPPYYALAYICYTGI